MPRPLPIASSRLLVCLAALWILAALQPAAAQPAADDPSAEWLRLRLEEILAEEESFLHRTFVGIQVADAETGRILFERNAEKLFTPASNVKLYTSACALDTWGADHRFTTQLGYRGRVERRRAEDAATTPPATLTGQIVLKGGGDPVFKTEDLAALADTMTREFGLEKFMGAIIIDNSLYAQTLKGPGWMWDDEPYYFNMSVTPLMLNYNVTTVTARPGAKIGDPPVVTMEPPSCSPQLDVVAVTGLAEELQRAKVTAPFSLEPAPFEIERRPFEDFIKVRGNLASTASPVTERVSVLHPTSWIDCVFRQMLEKRGVEFPAVSTGAPNGAINWLAEHDSPPLAEILGLFNKPSENAIGEALFLNLAARAGHVPATWEEGAQTLGDWLVAEAGLSPSEFRLVDGSGLSRYNLITPGGTVQLLLHMWRHPEREVFVESLPVAGVDGSLRSRLTASPARGNVFAKTGTMSGVSCLSGYARTAGGRWLAFSILTNGYIGSSAPSRGVQDRLCGAMASMPVLVRGEPVVPAAAESLAP